MSENDVIIQTIEQIAQKQSSLIKDLASQFFRDDDIADDILQEVLLKINKLLPKSFENETKLQNWLGQITLNFCKDVYRKNTSYQNTVAKYSTPSEEENQAPSPEQELEEQQVRDLIHGLIDKLDPEEQEIYKMYAFSGYNFKEIQKKSGKKRRHIRYIIERVNKDLYCLATQQGIEPR